VSVRQFVEREFIDLLTPYKHLAGKGKLSLAQRSSIRVLAVADSGLGMF